MASADLRDELLCSICLNLYTDPVTLRCGHNFCRGCIGRALNTQNEDGLYSCPQCRAEYRRRPALETNTTLRNIVETFMSTRQETHQEITGIYCTYCVDSPVPAVKSCLLCEASLCDKHLKFHSRSADHVLTDPRTSLENRRCPIHKKVLEYYCTQDSTCICVYCSAGVHRGHRVEMLDKASEEKKKKLKNTLQKLIAKREKTEEKVQNLEERWRKAQEKPSREAKRVTALFIDIRRLLDDLEKKILSEVSRQEEQLSRSLSDVIQKLEIKKDELSRKMRHIEELCNVTDPLTVLQDPDTGDLCDPEEGGGDEDTGGHDTTHDGDVITGMLHAGFSDIVTFLQTISPPKRKRPQPRSPRSLPSHIQASPASATQYGGIVRTGGEGAAAGEGGIYGQGPADILLDVNTAGDYILISDDMKTVTWTNTVQNRQGERRFYIGQVMSIGGFSSGRHYWDVTIRGQKTWKVGMCYPNILRKGSWPCIGYNNKSWSLEGRMEHNDQFSVIHDRNEIKLPHHNYSNRYRICLDYEGGQLSFYELCDPIRHLHTFTTTFTKPLHAVVSVLDGSIEISGGGAAGMSHQHRGNLPRD